MKAKIYSSVKTLVDVESNFPSTCNIPKGTAGTIVECFENPEGYAVDLAIPNIEFEGGVEFETLFILPDQFEVIKP